MLLKSGRHGYMIGCFSLTEQQSDRKNTKGNEGVFHLLMVKVVIIKYRT
jgi:hypothetical protein